MAVPFNASRRGPRCPGVTAFSRAVPTLVLIFYLATLVPNTLWIGSSSISIAPWLKAAIALAASPLGFTAWNLQTSIIAWRSGDRRAALLFIPNWMEAFVITLLASSTASLVGVSELLGRCNAVIASSGSGTMLPVYFYGSCVFFVFCSLINFSLDRLKQALFLRVSEGEVDARTE